MTAERAPEGDAATVRDLLVRLGPAARSLRRDDLDAVLRLARIRLERPDTVVCVAGEFKQGKSSLINAILGADLCPVDDDLATAALTLVRHGAEMEIRATRVENREPVVEPVDPAGLAELVTEAGNPGNERRVQLVEIAAPNPVLARGWVLVDTPGIGGFNEAQATAALGFLPLADALIFVSDAAAELGEHELGFLERARAVCPTVIVVLSKTDLYEGWRAIAAADARHLAARNLAAPLPVSAALRRVALDAADVVLNVESGTPALLERLDAEVFRRSRDLAVRRAADDAHRAIAQLALPLERELDAIRNPASGARADADLAAARERVQLIRSAATRWGQRLGDGFAELSATVDYGFRSAIRAKLRGVEDAIDESDPATTWEATAAELQRGVSAAVADAFSQLLEGTARLRVELAALLHETAEEHAPGVDPTLDVARLWSGKTITRSTVTSGLGLGFGALRGAQSGVYLLGLLGNLFQLAVVGPALLGGAVLFAGKSVVDERRRQLAQRRAEARAAVRQYLDDVQFEVGTRIRDTLRELQRDLRDDVASRIEERNRTYGETVAALERAARQDAAARQTRIQELEQQLDALRRMDREIAAAAAEMPHLSGSAA